MNNELNVFTFITPITDVISGRVVAKNSIHIRVVTLDGTPWFVARDVCDALGFTRTDNMLRVLDEGERGNSPRPMRGVDGRHRIHFIITESGLYKLIMRSDKPEAREFQDWVTKVVLPAIRKDGAYVMGEEKVATGEMSEDELILKAVGILQRKVERLTAERDTLAGTIEQELNPITVDEFRALSHQYWDQSFTNHPSI